MFLQVIWPLSRTSCSTLCTNIVLFLSCEVLSFFFKSTDPEKLMPDFVQMCTIRLYSTGHCWSLFMILYIIWWREAIVTFCALLSCVSPHMNLHQLWVLFFKSPDSEKLLTHFLHFNCFAPVCVLYYPWCGPLICFQFTWSLSSSCQTLCTHSFSTVGVLYDSSSFLMRRSYCHTWCDWMPSFLCESSHETLRVVGCFMFLQVKWLVMRW